MKDNNYKPRIIDNDVKRYLSAFGAVCIEGPKWCGKTWTSRHHSESEYLVGDPQNNFQNRQLAQLSPALILPGDTPRLIDEWQEVTSIWDAVRYEVDTRGKKGQFILTGSSTPKRKGILHSGVGRIGKLRMRPMTLYESGCSSGEVSLSELCEGKMIPKLTGDVDIRKLIDNIIRGGWPGNQDTPIESAALLPKEYIAGVIDDEVHRIDDIQRDKRKIELLLRSLARNESTTVTNSTILNDIKAVDDEELDKNTVSVYMDIFNRLFLTDNQLPFSTNIRSSVRVKQAEKRHFADPSLACALLGATPEKLLGDLNTLGFMFEALCERDLRIYAESFGAKLYHYQDYSNKEIDAVIELANGDWSAFEIKLGTNQIDSAAAQLIELKKSIEKEKNAIPPSVLCVICGMSNAAYQRPDGVYVVPITALKN
ncbi:MAG: ATP-binding protein [Ruminococcaceae bacterium]|nr:ATP-binding protein [Oscillospiraceae bacterium]